MTIECCDVCGKEIEGFLDCCESSSYTITKACTYDKEGTQHKMTLCANCNRAMYYFAENAKQLRLVDKLSFMNRIRFLFRMKLKDSEQNGTD